MAQILQLLAEYISRLPPQRSERMQALHQFIPRNYPLAKLTLKYQVPTYEACYSRVAIANHKHCAPLYICAREHIQPYLDRHPETRCGTDCLSFRDGDLQVLEDLRPVFKSAFRKDRINRYGSL